MCKLFYVSVLKTNNKYKFIFNAFDVKSKIGVGAHPGKI